MGIAGFLIYTFILFILQGLLYLLKRKKIINKNDYLNLAKCALICFHLLVLPSVIEFGLSYLFCIKVKI